MLAFYSEDPSSNPVDAYIFTVDLAFEKTKKTKRAGVVLFLKKHKRTFLGKGIIKVFLPKTTVVV